MTAPFDLVSLRELLIESAGEGDELAAITDPDEFADTSFDDLGYDSIALLEVVSRIEQRLGVALPEETVADATTPRRFVSVVTTALNGSLTISHH